MARYKVLEKSFIDGVMYDAGDEVEYAGDRIGPNLQYVSGKKPKDTYEITDIPLVDPNANSASGPIGPSTN